MIGNILLKLSRGIQLTEAERQQLRLFGNETELNNSFVSGMQSGASDVFAKSIKSLDFPIVVLYSKVLESNTASVVVNLPSTYKHIIVYGSGSITSANGGNIWAQFNSDTGNNYSWQFIKGDGATISGGQDTSDPYVALGVFGTTGAGAGVNGSFRAEIMHYQGAWKKNVLSHCYTAEFNDLYLLGSTWANTAPIRTIEIFGTDNTLAKGTTNVASGSLFTVYATL